VRRILRLPAVLAVLGAVGCSSHSTSPPSPATQIVVTPGAPATLASGASLQLNAKVLDANGNPVSDQSVTWSTSDATKATVSQSGSVGGLKIGVATITATQGSLTSNGVQVTVTQGAPTTLTRAPDAPASLVAGSVRDSIGVTVTDAGGNPVSGASVTFTPAAGSGTASPTMVITNAAGHAATEWHVGTVAGPDQITATAANSSASTTFTSTITPGPLAQVQLTSSRTAVVDSGSSVTPTFTGADAYGNAITGTALTFATRNAAAASVNASGVVSGGAHGQAIVVASATQNAALADSVLVLVAQAAQPAVYTDLPAFALKADTTIVVTLFVDMRSSGQTMGSTQVNLAWNPGVLTYVSDADGSSGVGATVNNTNAATGALDIAAASAAGFSGQVQLRRITFRAAATAGQTGTLVPSVVELAGAGTYTVLTAVTVSASYPVATR
jgi:adhesin/invasin